MARQINKDKLREEIEIPEGIDARIDGNVLICSKDDKVLKRKLDSRVNVEIKDRKIIVSIDKPTRNKKKMFGTMKAHIKNMKKGLSEGFKYKLKIAFVHFPMNVSLDKENNILVVKNFLGEKTERKIKVYPEVEVKVNKEDIEIESHDIEKAGQAATNIEKGTRVRKKDRRIYQDGIYITEKPGREFI